MVVDRKNFTIYSILVYLKFNAKALDETFVAEIVKAMMVDVKTITSMMEHIKIIKISVTQIEVTTNRFTAVSDELKKDNEMLKSKVEKLTNQNQYLTSKLKESRILTNIRNRIDNIINGIPYQENENIVNVIKEVANHFEINLENHDICMRCSPV